MCVQRWRRSPPRRSCCIAPRTGSIPIGHARALADSIPHAHYVELKGSDHLGLRATRTRSSTRSKSSSQGSAASTSRNACLRHVLFTDIVSSTERAAAIGDRDWRRILERHDEVVRRELARCRGREIKQTGDGFLAAFDGPARAVRLRTRRSRSESAARN